MLLLDVQKVQLLII